MYPYQAFPEMVAIAIQIYIDPNIKPVNLKTPAPVPLHCIGRNRCRSSVTWCWAKIDWTCATRRIYKMVFTDGHFSQTWWRTTEDNSSLPIEQVLPEKYILQSPDSPLQDQYRQNSLRCFEGVRFSASKRTGQSSHDICTAVGSLQI